MENAKLSLTSKTRFKARYQLITKTKPIQKKVQDASLCVEWGKNKIIVSFVKEIAQVTATNKHLQNQQKILFSQH